MAARGGRSRSGGCWRCGRRERVQLAPDTFVVARSCHRPLADSPRAAHAHVFRRCCWAPSVGPGVGGDGPRGGEHTVGGEGRAALLRRSARRRRYAHPPLRAAACRSWLRSGPVICIPYNPPRAAPMRGVVGMSVCTGRALWSWLASLPACRAPRPPIPSARFPLAVPACGAHHPR